MRVSGFVTYRLQLYSIDRAYHIGDIGFLSEGVIRSLYMYRRAFFCKMYIMKYHIHVCPYYDINKIQNIQIFHFKLNSFRNKIVSFAD